MNRLPLAKRVQVLASLVEGNSLRATARMTGVAFNTVLKLMEDVGDACAAYHDDTIRDLTCVRVQCDEIWSFVHAKERNLKPKYRGLDGYGDLWTWVGIDADTKLLVSYVLGKRTPLFARRFMRDLSERIKSYVQVTTDGLAMYKDAVRYAFGHRVDYGTEVKVFGFDNAESPERKYSPAVVTEMRRTRVLGAPDPDYISTAHIERQNLNMRMSMRRFTRLTNAFSKKARNLQRSVALYAVHYNWVRRHSTLKTTPAIAHGLTDRVWTLEDIASLPDYMSGGLAA
jgi:IS1 family transposase